VSEDCLSGGKREKDRFVNNLRRTHCNAGEGEKKFSSVLLSEFPKMEVVLMQERNREKKSSSAVNVIGRKTLNRRK